MAKEQKPSKTSSSFELVQFNQWHAEFSKESDRAAVILGAAKLDLGLRDLLARKLLPNPSGQDELLDTDKPISSFSARINLAYRLGLIDKQFANWLHLIRRIRNDFAHEAVGADLGSGSHRDRVKELVSPFRKKKQFEELASKYPSKLPQASKYFRAVLSVLIVRLEGATQSTRTVDETDAYDIMPPWSGAGEEAETK